jgi:hypothetical protein
MAIGHFSYQPKFTCCNSDRHEQNILNIYKYLKCLKCIILLVKEVSYQYING